MSEINEITERIDIGKANEWDYKNLGKIYEDFKNTEMYKLIRWEAENNIKRSIRNIRISGHGLNSHDYWNGYHSGMQAILDVIDERVAVFKELVDIEKNLEKEKELSYNREHAFI